MSKQAGSMKYRQYSPSKVASAVSVVQSGAMSKRKAALTFGIPRSTLLDKLSGKAPVGTNLGKPCVLNAAEESVLVDYVKLMASIGYPLNPFPNKPWFLRVCSTSPLKTPWEKEKLLITSNFSFSHNVFYPFEELSAIFVKFEIVVCKLFQFEKV